MSAVATSENLAKFAHDYLATLNPLAEKVNSDIEDVIKNYEDYWNSLKAKEKEKFIGKFKSTLHNAHNTNLPLCSLNLFFLDEALIKSEITLKYYDNFDSRSGSTESLSGSGCKFDGKNLMSFFKQKTGKSCFRHFVSK